jgi:hypothetical protein
MSLATAQTHESVHVYMNDGLGQISGSLDFGELEMSLRQRNMGVPLSPPQPLGDRSARS